MAETETTQLLRRLAAGDRDAGEALAPLVYDELRALASRHLARERPDHTLQPTAVVHEAWLKLLGDSGPDCPSSGHFFALASKIMRSLLVDHARRQRAAKRGGDRARVTLERVDAAGGSAPPLDVLDLHGALEDLSALDEELGRLVELRFFGGLTMSAIAEVLDLPLRTVERRWTVASAWLREALDG